jgi:hypothetical protein
MIMMHRSALMVTRPHPSYVIGPLTFLMVGLMDGEIPESRRPSHQNHQNSKEFPKTGGSRD